MARNYILSLNDGNNVTSFVLDHSEDYGIKEFDEMKKMVKSNVSIELYSFESEDPGFNFISMKKHEAKSKKRK